MTQLLIELLKYLMQVLTELRDVRSEIQDVKSHLKQQEKQTMALQENLDKLKADIAAYKQKQAEAQAAEDTLEQGQASTLTDLTARVAALETIGSPQVAELASQVEQVVTIVNELVAHPPTTPPPTPPVEPPTEPTERMRRR